jgi:flagellar biosynthesis chaperone FliJ
MTNKEKEKLFYTTIKAESKHLSWKFKSYFVFKLVDNFFYESNFYFDPKANRIWGWLAFKPYSVDDLFWEIAGMSENKKMPLSFRAEAAFKVTSHTIFEFDTIIDKFEKLEDEIKLLFSKIENEILNNATKVSSLEQYVELLDNQDKDESVAILTALLQLEQYNITLNKLESYRQKDVSSGFRFGKKDYYDLIESYIKKKTKRPFWKFFNN